MQLQNVTLMGLPQLHETEGSMWRQPGRLLRQLGSTVTPPGIWTCLLWPWRRWVSPHYAAKRWGGSGVLVLSYGMLVGCLGLCISLTWQVHGCGGCWPANWF
jgi:hypothetical protein